MYRLEKKKSRFNWVIKSSTYAATKYDVKQQCSENKIGEHQALLKVPCHTFFFFCPIFDVLLSCLQDHLSWKCPGCPFSNILVGPKGLTDESIGFVMNIWSANEICSVLFAVLYNLKMENNFALIGSMLYLGGLGKDDAFFTLCCCLLVSLGSRIQRAFQCSATRRKRELDLGARCQSLVLEGRSPACFRCFTNI